MKNQQWRVITVEWKYPACVNRPETETIPNCFDLCETMFQACNWGWTLHRYCGLCEKYVNEKVCTKYVFEGELYAECVNVRPRPLSMIHWYIIHVAGSILLCVCLQALYCSRPFWRVARMTDSASWEQSCSGDPLIPAYAASLPLTLLDWKYLKNMIESYVIYRSVPNYEPDNV